MAAQNKYKVARYGDRKWIELFRSAIDRKYFDTVSFTGVGSISGLSLAGEEELPELMKFIYDQNTNVIHAASANKGGISISLARTESPLYDDLTFNWNPQNQKALLSDQQRIEIISWFTGELLKVDPDRGLFTGTGIAEAAENELALRNATIERFEQVQAKLAEDTAAFNKTIQENYLAEKAKLDAQFEKDRDKLNEEYSKKNDAIDKRKLELDEREAEIDASDNTAARRQIRKDLLEEIQKRSEKFALTAGTERLRWPVHLVSLLIIISAIAGAYYFGEKIPVASDSINIAYVIMLLKPLGLTFVAVGTAFFYLRWLNRWFEQHAQAEFKLKQFQLDIERASWLVETALDWDAKQDKELPKELLEGLSKNLFHFDEDKIDQVRHPVDELASALMGTASKVRLNLGGNEVELDGKRLKNAAK